jgi:uncharacterized protein
MYSVMKANPGGQIDSADIIGRDAVISELWERLAQQSIVLTAERRMGKTTIVKQMEQMYFPSGSRQLCQYK